MNKIFVIRREFDTNPLMRVGGGCGSGGEMVS